MSLSAAQMIFLEAVLVGQAGPELGVGRPQLLRLVPEALLAGQAGGAEL